MHEKTNNLGFRPGPTQTGLYKLRKELEALNFGFKKKRNCTIRVAKTKALISFAVTAKLICVFVFAYANCWFSHAQAQMNISEASWPILIKCDVNHHWVGGLVVLGFGADCIKIVVSMATNSSHRITMGKHKKKLLRNHMAKSFHMLCVAMYSSSLHESCQYNRFGFFHGSWRRIEDTNSGVVVDIIYLHELEQYGCCQHYGLHNGNK